MPILRACVECGRLSSQTRCPDHRHLPDRRRDAKRSARGKRRGSTPEYRRNRAKALERDGYRCTYVDGNGVRCAATRETHRLVTHHRNGDHHDNRTENLATLCESHHKLIERLKRRLGRRA